MKTAHCCLESSLLSKTVKHFSTLLKNFLHSKENCSLLLVKFSSSLESALTLQDYKKVMTRPKGEEFFED